MWSALIVLLLQAAGATTPVTGLAVEAKGQTWGAFAGIVREGNGGVSVSLEDGWIDPAFLGLWWPQEMTEDEALAPGFHSFDPSRCHGHNVEVRRTPGPGRSRSWMLLGACVVAYDVASRPNDGRVEIRRLTFRVEDIGMAM